MTDNNFGADEREWRDCETGIEGNHLDGRSSRAQAGVAGQTDLRDGYHFEHNSSTEQQSQPVHGSEPLGSTYYPNDCKDPERQDHYNHNWYREHGKGSFFDKRSRDHDRNLQPILMQAGCSKRLMKAAIRRAIEADKNGFKMKARHSLGEGEEYRDAAINLAIVWAVAVEKGCQNPDAAEEQWQVYEVYQLTKHSHNVPLPELLEYAYGSYGA